MGTFQLIILTLVALGSGTALALVWSQKPKFYPALQEYLSKVQQQSLSISPDRKAALDRLREYALQREYKGKQTSLLFMCAENCGRSILTQVWLEVMARAYDLPQLLSYSGGTLPAKLDPQLVQVLEQAGIQVTMAQGTQGEHMQVRLGPKTRRMNLFAKYFDHVTNPKKNFVAITTDHYTQENLDRVPGAHFKLPMVYDKPKSAQELEELSATIAAEMMYLSREIKAALDPLYLHQEGVLRYTKLKPLARPALSKQHVAA